MGARIQVEIELPYRPARPDRLAEFILWNKFLGSMNVEKYGLSFKKGFFFILVNVRRPIAAHFCFQRTNKRAGCPVT
jgi:hypothetical protein